MTPPTEIPVPVGAHAPRPEVALRPPPRWVGDFTFSSLDAAWAEAPRPTLLLTWLADSIDGAAPAVVADVRRRLGRAIRTLVPVPRSRYGPVQRLLDARAAFVSAWLRGEEFDEAEHAALCRAEDDVFAASNTNGQMRADLARNDGGGMGVSRSVVAMLNAAKAPTCAVHGSPAGLQHTLESVVEHAFDASEWFAALRAEFPHPPTGYAAPGLPSRWLK